MMRLQIEAPLLEEILKAASKFGEEISFEDKEDGLLVNAGSLGGGYFFVSKISSVMMQHYTPGNKTYACKIDVLKKIVKALGKSIILEEDGGRIKAYNDTKSFFIDIFEASELKEMANLPDMIVFSMESSVWKEVIEELSIFGFSAKFSYVDHIFSILSRNDSNKVVYTRTFNSDHALGDSKSTYNINLLPKFISSINKSVNISFGNGMPLKVDYSYAGLKVVMVLAAMAVEE